MVSLAVSLPTLIVRPIPLLMKGVDKEFMLSQEQVIAYMKLFIS
jgi:hypothetical protein